MSIHKSLKWKIYLFAGITGSRKNFFAVFLITNQLKKYQTAPSQQIPECGFQFHHD